MRWKCKENVEYYYATTEGLSSRTHQTCQLPSCNLEAFVHSQPCIPPPTNDSGWNKTLNQNGVMGMFFLLKWQTFWRPNETLMMAHLKVMSTMYSTARMTVIQTEGADIAKILEIYITVLNQGCIQRIYTPYILRKL